MTHSRRTSRATLQRLARHRRVRGKLSGTPERPRLAVFRSAKHIYAQIIDDRSGRTLVATNDLILAKAAKGKSSSRPGKNGWAKAVGETIATAALAKRIKQVAFDRGGFLYTGRIKTLAEAARAGGLDF